MTCACGHDELDPTITGLYTLPGNIPYGVGYACAGCGTDRTILWAAATDAQRAAAYDVDQATHPEIYGEMMGR